LQDAAIHSKKRETLWMSRRSSKMGLLLQQLGSQRLLNHLFMVEFVEPIPTKITGLTNIDARQDNNIVVFEEEVQERRNKATGKKKYIRIVGCQKPLEVC